MDISETYVKMCRKTVEIQKEWNPVSGDSFTYSEPKHKDGIVLFESSILNISGWKEYGATWLPRQDQLQEMIKEKPAYSVPIGMVTGLHHYTYSREAKFVNSMEQLWLAFVMKEKYGKVWNGEDWK